MAKYAEMESYFSAVQQMLAAKQSFEDVGVASIEEVQIKYETFKQTVNALFTAPPPKQEPPKQEPKPDVEMKDEAPK
jgi:hypothetical protein